MGFIGRIREWTMPEADLGPEELAFCRRWVRNRNESVAVVSALISGAFHASSLATDPHIAAPRYLTTLTALHLAFLGVLITWVAVRPLIRVRLQNVLHTINVAAVLTYVWILYSCVTTPMPKEDLLLASVAVSLLSVFAILLSPCGVRIVALSAAGFWLVAFLAYGSDQAGPRWMIINALGLGNAVAFQWGRLLLARKEGLREYERLRLLGERARGEAHKRKKVEIQLKETEVRAKRASEMAFLTEMTGGIAHEIDNPLTVLTLRATSMRERAKHQAISSEEIIEFTTRIEATAFRIAKIIKGIRAIGRRAEADSFEDESVESIVEDVVEICQGRLKTGGVELRPVQIEPGLVVSCRGAEIGQVLLNLVNNAVDAVADRGDRWIELCAKTEGQSVVITVTDSGPGIPRAQREKIFEPFFTTKKRGQGTGLGLGIVKGIMDRHGGTISVDERCTNTRFVVRLPIGNVFKPDVAA